MKAITTVLLALGMSVLLYAAEDVVSAVHGTVEKIDSGTKTVVVKTADGTKLTFLFTESTTVHGAESVGHSAEEAGKDSWKGISKGSEVAVHYTGEGVKASAVEVDKLGKDGLTATTGTIKAIDRGGKTVVVKTAKGAEETFHLTEHAAADTAKGVAKGAEKGSKVVVYSTEEAGRKVVHFFERM